MALDRIDAIDAIGIEKETDRVILTIIDSWDWKNEEEHLLALQSKINAYLDFIESGQIYESYPKAVNKALVIDVVGKFTLSVRGALLLKQAEQVGCALGVLVRHTHYDQSLT